MDGESFDRLTRRFSTPLTRRTLASTFSLAALGLPGLAAGKKKHKRKRHRHKKKVKRNEFGCVDVGKFCKNNGQCCSGICKGKKDKKKCKAHGESTCQSGQDVCGGLPVPCLTETGESGSCSRTTGKSGYCEADGDCFACSKDADCVPFCGPQAACIACPTCIGVNGTQTACVGPNDDSCSLPPPPP